MPANAQTHTHFGKLLFVWHDVFDFFWVIYNKKRIINNFTMELQWQVALNVIARACNPVSWAVQCPAFNKHREKKTQNLRLQSLSVLVNHCVPEFVCVLSTQYFARSARNARIYIFIKLTVLKGLGVQLCTSDGRNLICASSVDQLSHSFVIRFFWPFFRAKTFSKSDPLCLYTDSNGPQHKRQEFLLIYRNVSHN